MKLLLISAMLLTGTLRAQELSDAESAEPGAGRGATAAGPSVRRPDPQSIMSDLSGALRLSSKQEDRIAAAVKKEASEFDRLLKEYEKCTAEEKKWRLKANEARYRMLKINRDLPDLIREFLDDEQRESYAQLLEAQEKEQPPAAKPQPAAGKPQPPARKKKLVRRKKAPAPAQPPAEEEGGVIVDNDGPKAPPKKGSLKNPAPGPELPPGEVGYPPGSRNNPAAAAIAEQGDDAEVGSYP